MKKILLSILMLGAVATSFAQEHHHDMQNPNITPYADAVDARNGINGLMHNQSAAWQSFVAKHPSWGAKFNYRSGMPQRAVGEPIALGAGNAVDVVKNFLQTELAAYAIPNTALKLTGNNVDEKYTNVNFTQVHQGMEVLFSRITFRLTPKNELILFGLQGYKNIPTLPLPSITPAAAVQYAKAAVVTTVKNATVEPATKIIAVPNGNTMAYHVVYACKITTQDTKEMEGIYYTIVDAQTGKIWYRQNKVTSITGDIKGYTWNQNQFNAKTLRGLPYIQYEVNSTLYNANVNGTFNIPGNNPVTGYIDLQGPYCKVVDGENATATTPSPYMTATFNNGNITFDTTNAATKTTKVNCYYHVNVVHDFMKSKLGASFTAMDNPMLTRVDRTDGSCNAFYNGSSINFYETGGNCSPTGSIADVVYHEYGHGINYEFWNANGGSFDNGAMGEGYSDMWAMSIINWPVIGPGFYTNSATNGIRQYNAAPKVYPKDIIGEVHADGEIIAGAWWDTYVNWGNLDSTASLFAKSMNGLANGPDGAEGQLYFDILLDALTYDDNDGNINNGTPHFTPIVKAFARHGIYLLSEASVVHTPIPTAVAASSTNTFTANVTVNFPAFLGPVKMLHRFKKSGVANPVDTMALTNAGSNNFTGTFPTGVAGKVLEYVYAIYDISSPGILSASAPTNSLFSIPLLERNIPYYVVYGNKLHYAENFEGAAANWTIGLSNDNATSGKWIVATPMQSSTSADIVQTGKDHTTGSGKCAVTGNATSSTSSVGSADVDGGRTTIASPVFDLSGLADPIISYWRWFSNSQSTTNPGKDIWRVMISNNGGNTFTQYSERTFAPDVSWRRQVIRLKDITAFTTLTDVVVMFVAIDSNQGNGGTLVEAALDDFEIYDPSTPAGINEVDLASSIAPNPANTQVIVTLQNIVKVATVNVLDLTGKKIYTQVVQNTSTITIPTAQIADGMYLIQVVTDDKQNAYKVVIQH